MGAHSIVEAKNQLSSLIDPALAGETVVITRHGTPVAEIRPVAKRAGRRTPRTVEWLRSRRSRRPLPSATGPSMVATLRDEGDERPSRR